MAQIGGQPLQALRDRAPPPSPRRRRRRAGRSCRPARRTDRRCVPPAAPPAAGRAAPRRRPAPTASPGRSRGSASGCGAGRKPHGSGRQHRATRPAAACPAAASGRAGPGADARWRWRAPRRPRRSIARPGCPAAGRPVPPARPDRRCHPAQHGIDQAGERGEAAGPGQRHGGGDGGMRRRFQQQHPRGAQPQHVAHRFRRLPFAARAPAPRPACPSSQHRGGEAVRRRPVARRYRGGRASNASSSGRPAVQHGGQQIEGGFAGRVGHGGDAVWSRQGAACNPIGNVTDGAQAAACVNTRVLAAGSRALWHGLRIIEWQAAQRLRAAAAARVGARHCRRDPRAGIGHIRDCQSVRPQDWSSDPGGAGRDAASPAARVHLDDRRRRG